MNTDYLNKENYCSSGLSGLPPAFLCRLEETIVLALSLLLACGQTLLSNSRG